MLIGEPAKDERGHVEEVVFLDRSGVKPMTERARQRLIEDLQRQIQERAILLSDLEVIIEDYQRERARLLQELRSLKEGLWDLTSDSDQGLGGGL
jgi:hypothetical protein